jgi:hypothetical protein
MQGKNPLWMCEAMSRRLKVRYTYKVLIVAFLGPHVPLLALAISYRNQALGLRDGHEGHEPFQLFLAHGLNALCEVSQ